MKNPFTLEDEVYHYKYMIGWINFFIEAGGVEYAACNTFSNGIYSVLIPIKELSFTFYTSLDKPNHERTKTN